MSEKSFENIQLTTGKQMTSSIGGTTETADVRLYVTDSSGRVIEEIEGKVTTVFPFTDVKQADWFYNSVIDVYNGNLMVGTSATTFAPQSEIIIANTADKLRWCRYRKGLLQRDVADYADIDRSTYVHYEEATRDFYPLDKMEKLAELFEAPLEDLLYEYNLFLYRGQGRQIKAMRKAQGMRQQEFALKFGIPITRLKGWEQDKSKMSKSSWESLFK